MPNAIKYSTSAQTLALKKGNYWIGTGDVGKGPTSTTDYWNGITPPSGGYTIYLNKASGGPSIYTAANDSQLVSLTNTISSITTNYISNGGNFSNGTISPFIYDYTGAGGVARVVSIANDRPYAGSSSTNALELNYNGGRALDATGLLTVGQTYTFSFWAKVTSGSSFSIGWNNQNGSGDTNSWSSGGFTITTSWQRYSQVFTYNAARTTFYFYTRNQTVGTLAVFTEFQLSLGSAPCGPGLTTATESINWFLTQTDKMVFSADYPAIVTNGLVMNLDAGFTPSITSLPTNIVGGGYSSYTPVWYDVSSGGSNGELINSPTYSSSNGGSIMFDGVDDYVLTSLNASSFASLDMSLGLWFNTKTIENNAFTLLSGARANNDAYQPLGFFIETRNSWAGNYSNNPGIVAISNYPRYAKSAPNAIANDTWYYVVQTATETQTKLYINGTLVDTTTANTTLYTSIPYYFGVGSYGNYGTYPGTTQYNGYYSNQSIAVTQIYNRELTAAEVLQNYNAQKSRFGL